MSDYNRTTRECPVSQLHPEVRKALRKYFQEHELGNLETETLVCCETVSEKKSAGGLASWLNDELDTTIHTGMILTSEWLIWVRSGDKSGTLLAAASLKNITVREYFSILTQDTGLEVTGFLEDSKSRIQGNIAMGRDLAAQKFCDEVKQAITKANPPTKKGWPKWMGG
jgi:hypothetical protein